MYVFLRRAVDTWEMTVKYFVLIIVAVLTFKLTNDLAFIAFATAMDADPELLSRAANFAAIYQFPATVIAGLTVVAVFWQLIAQSKTQSNTQQALDGISNQMADLSRSLSELADTHQMVSERQSEVINAAVSTLVEIELARASNDIGRLEELREGNSTVGRAA